MRYQHEHQSDTGDENPPPASNPQPTTRVSNSKPTALLRCSLCGKSFDRSETPAMPFCSLRCQQVDLGRWLNESYGMPYEGEARPTGADFDE